jgi:hypothetical protein
MVVVGDREIADDLLARVSNRITTNEVRGINRGLR